MAIHNIQSTILSDSYKQGHYDMYPEDLTFLYSNFTPRKSRVEGVNAVIFFGLQYFLKEYLINSFNKTFFERPKEAVLSAHKEFVAPFATGDVTLEQWSALHDLGYLPIEIKALPEGTACPIGIPMLTIQNTHPKFAWLVNFIETILSTSLWLPITSATTAKRYRDIVEKWCEKTGGDMGFIDWQCHDFSMRGMASLEAACTSGAAHLTSFKGSDTIPAVPFLKEYYGATGIVAGSVNATEHSVQSVGGQEEELITFERLLDKYPSGIISIVSDTWDLWKVCTEYLPSLKDKILNRDGKCVIRPDCYSDDTEILTEQGWCLFTDLAKGQKVAQVLDNGTYEFVEPLKHVCEYYEGDMIRFYDWYGKVDLLVTPNHNMFFVREGEEFYKQEASNCTFYWGKSLKRSALSIDTGKRLTPTEALKIAFQADGSFCTKGKKIRFSFSKKRKIDRLFAILNKEGIKYSVYNLKDGRFEISVDVNAEDYRKDFDWVDTSNLCSAWCKEFIEELSYWDATRRGNNRFKFDTTNVSVVNKVELIGLSAGYGVLISKRKDNRKPHFSDVYTLHILKDNRLGGQAIKKEVVQYKGYIVCVTVPSNRLLVRRNRGQIVCGNSGDPADIICGKDGGYSTPMGKTGFLSDLPNPSPEVKGVIELLWDTFGGTINEKGYKVLDPHIGCIYGDSITPERAETIFRRLEEKGFCSTNVVLGIGSYTYNYVTRDTFGMAMKATYCERNGVGKVIFKDPVTDSGEKRSARGLLCVHRPEGRDILLLLQEVSKEVEKTGVLETVFKDSTIVKETSLEEIRSIVSTQNIK